MRVCAGVLCRRIVSHGGRAELEQLIKHKICFNLLAEEWMISTGDKEAVGHLYGPDTGSSVLAHLQLSDCYYVACSSLSCSAM